MRNYFFTGFPSLILRYVDDTFACLCSRNKALSFIHCLNELHSSLTFVIDEEKDNTLPFLDVLVECRLFAFITNICRKPTFTGLYLSCDTFAPESRKVNLIKYLTFRALKICSDNKIKSEFDQIRIHFWVMGILKKALLTPLTKQLVSLGITSGYLALLNIQFMLDFLGLNPLTS